MDNRMICHTRNFEDVIIQRALSDVQAGHYIDVGASNSVVDSNTYSLYRKGWRGVGLEPLPHAEAEWARVRPGDKLLKAAAGAAPGTMTLHVYDSVRQASSGSQSTVARLKSEGLIATSQVTVPVVTLNDVIAEHLPGRPIHLVSIDVEGMEPDVLRGLDLSVHRPWLMVLEAVFTGSPQPMHQAWEPGLLEAGYMLAYFDGVNRFYLAREQRHLLGRFALPPNVWDNFVTARELGMQTRMADLEAQLAALQAGAKPSP